MTTEFPFPAMHYMLDAALVPIHSSVSYNVLYFLVCPERRVPYGIYFPLLLQPTFPLSPAMQCLKESEWVGEDGDC
jgi:hypothetical protein